ATSILLLFSFTLLPSALVSSLSLHDALPIYLHRICIFYSKLFIAKRFARSAYRKSIIVLSKKGGFFIPSAGGVRMFIASLTRWVPAVYRKSSVASRNVHVCRKAFFSRAFG